MHGITRTWLTDVPPADERPGRQFVAVIGRKNHSGLNWHRLGVGIAGTLYGGQQGYYAEHIRQIEKEAGMDPHSGVVVAWMPIDLPPVPEEIQREECALPMPERDSGSHPTGQDGEAGLVRSMAERPNEDSASPKQGRGNP